MRVQFSPLAPPNLRLTLSVVQSGEFAIEILERFRKAIGHGLISKAEIREGRLPRYRLHVSTQTDIKEVIDKLWPYLSSAKRTQITKAKSNLENLLAFQKILRRQ